MQLANRRARRVTLDLTPLIDVVLMLVIFFMLTTTFVLSPGVQVDLPKGSAMQEPRESDTIITITKDGRLFFQDAEVSLKTLGASLKRSQQQQPKLRVVIKADTLVQHGQVVAVMDMAKLLGIDRLAIATAPKSRAQ